MIERLLEDLSKSVGEEDEANHKLWEARNKTRRLVEENLVALANMGVIKISVNRQILNKALPPARAK